MQFRPQHNLILHLPKVASCGIMSIAMENKKILQSGASKSGPANARVSAKAELRGSLQDSRVSPKPKAVASARSGGNASPKRRDRISAKRKRVLAFGRVCELTGGRAMRWRRCGISAAEAFMLRKAGDPGYFVYLEYIRGVNPREAERVKSAARRPLYYEAENARRRALAEERRKVRARRTTNRCPTAAEIMSAWERVGESHEATLRLGSMLEDLECYVDNSLRFNEDGDIVGRNQGIKGWLHDNAPILYDRYTSVMRYKAMAKKLRQIAEIKDPVSASAIFGQWKAKKDYVADEIAERGERVDVGEGKACGVAGGVSGAGRKVIADGGSGVRMEVPDVTIVRAMAIWSEVIAGIADNPTALVRRVDELVDPERIGDANMLAEWKVKYANEITLRTKSKWWRQLKEKVG